MRQIRIWNPENGEEACKPLAGHSQFITWISWEPLHRYEIQTSPKPNHVLINIARLLISARGLCPRPRCDCIYIAKVA